VVLGIRERTWPERCVTGWIRHDPAAGSAHVPNVFCDDEGYERATVDERIDQHGAIGRVVGDARRNVPPSCICHQVMVRLDDPDRVWPSCEAPGTAARGQKGDEHPGHPLWKNQEL